MEYITIISIVLNILITLEYIRTKIELNAVKRNMTELCLLMLDDEEISKEDKMKVFEIYKKLNGGLK